ncbi:hypothetical protein C8A03DRAFT_45098 [Achaetomium macrosporum]|uniref:Zn(2)-C6 fungal-type domain-containing protein n=1 Tax=Achaetomium macrosporum TaxID=79813 RepID=A0AAN7HEA0_9PEZI|nr:hypothetical protein C8A03DRAFT_45098 [Achaetomium macrosporum]
MEALLGASPSNPSCGSIADLQGQLGELLSGRVTETRAEQVSVTFEIRATTVFEVPVTENENNALENASNIDPLLGGARSSAAPAADGNSGGQPRRRINAIDALINQPVDDPSLQTTITRHIIASLGEMDGSKWTVRQVSRNEHGWTFIYICKDSWQAWNRQAAKTPAKTVIGEWSKEDGQDPVHLARPAFDCRGSVKIAFVKSTKTIDVKYEHTPMHKTVGQLIELLAPPPPPPVEPLVRTPARGLRQLKPAKEPGQPREPKLKTPRSSKKRTGENGVPDGEGSQPKKRRKKQDATALPGFGVIVLPPEMPGALPVGDTSARQLYDTQAETAEAAQPSGSSSYPEGHVGAAAHDGSAGNSEVHSSILQLPPGEAARRRDVAIKLLNDNYIDPKTLSVEQFNIFANQSPELQQDSLAMLIKYGAERLRIVHPNRAGSSSAQSTPNKHNTSGAAGGTPQSGKPKKSRKSDVGTSDAAEGSKRKRMCDNCRIKKYKDKCDKARPSCSMCLVEGVACVYSAAPPRRSKAAEAAPPMISAPTDAQTPNDAAEDSASPGLHAQRASQAVHESVDESVNEPGQFHEQFSGHHLQETVDMPGSELVSHQMEQPSAGFTQTDSIYEHSSGLSFPQVSTATSTEPPQPSMPPATMESISMDYMSNSISETPEAPLQNFTYPQPSATHQDGSGYGEQTTPVVEQDQSRSSAGQASTARRGLPTGQPSHGSGTSSGSTNTQSSWQAMSGAPSKAESAAGSSPRQSRAKRPAPVSQAYDNLQQRQAASWANANQSVSQTAQPAQESPRQAAAQVARAKSRQSNRAQSHTPVNSMSTARQAQPQGGQSVVDSSGYSSSAATQQPGSSQGYNNFGQYQSGNTQAESSSDRITYQPYSNNQTSAQPNAYSSFDSYGTPLPNAASSNTSTSASQNVASSYPSNSALTSNASQWGASTSTSQARNARAYNATQSASSGNTSYNRSSNTPQSQSLHGFNVRPQQSTQARSSSSLYGQQAQQPQQQRQQQQSYSGYLNNVTQQQHGNGNHQSWYGFPVGATNASSGYNSAAAATGGNNAYAAATATSHGHPQSQHHRSMNLQGHTYSSLDNGQPLYDPYRSNPTG